MAIDSEDILYNTELDYENILYIYINFNNCLYFSYVHHTLSDEVKNLQRTLLSVRCSYIMIHVL